jgi:putative Mg2+ transporter-C (MgtC) family protein
MILFLSYLIKKFETTFIEKRKISEIDDDKHILVKKVMHFSLPKYVNSKYFFNIIKKFEGVIELTRIN